MCKRRAVEDLALEQQIAQRDQQRPLRLQDVAGAPALGFEDRTDLRAGQSRVERDRAHAPFLQGQLPPHDVDVVGEGVGHDVVVSETVGSQRMDDLVGAFGQLIPALGVAVSNCELEWKPSPPNT